MKDHEKPFYAEIGRRIKSHRTALFLEPADMAKVIQKSKDHYNKYERAETKCSIQILSQIAEALNCDITMLLPEKSMSGAGFSEQETAFVHRPDEDTEKRFTMQILTLFRQIETPSRRQEILKALENESQKMEEFQSKYDF